MVERFSSESEGVGSVVKRWVVIRNDSLRTRFLYTVFIFAIAVLRASGMPLLFRPKENFILTHDQEPVRNKPVDVSEKWIQNIDHG